MHCPPTGPLVQICAVQPEVSSLGEPASGLWGLLDLSSKWIKDLTVTEFCSHDPLARGRLLKRAVKAGEGHCLMTDEDATGLADAIAARLS